MIFAADKQPRAQLHRLGEGIWGGRGTVVEIVCPDIRRGFAVLKTVPGVSEVQLFGDRLNAVVADADREIPAIEAALSAAGIPVLQRRVLAPSLENVFISATESATLEAGHA